MIPALQISGLRKSYGALTVLQDIDLQLAPGASLAVVGRSGSGKTTLLSCIAGLEAPDAGTVSIAGRQLDGLDEDGLADLRLRSIGFIFQSFRLLPHVDALENVRLPLDLLGRRDAAAEATTALRDLGLGDRLGHRPAQLSGGEQQRVAIARALVTRPDLVLADEPTGNLDERTASEVEDRLFAVGRERGAALVLVTHDRRLADHAERRCAMQAGRMVDESSP